MSQTDLFAMLGAPLVNSQWSWGAIRESDGAVFLRVWQDETRPHTDCLIARITYVAKFQDDSEKLGYKERLEHVEQIKQDAQCYMIMCEAKDVNARPRKVEDFNKEELFVGGKLVEIEGNWWIELRGRKRVGQVVPQR